MIPSLARSLPRRVLDPIALAIAKTGLTPNALTALGFLGSLGAAALLAHGQKLAGGLVILLAGAMDLLDGALARTTGRASTFGAILDSVSDRLSEAAVLAGLLFYYSDRAARQEVMLIYAALAGSLLVSYVRARAEGVGLALRQGLFTRPERVIILAVGLIIDQVTVVLWLLAVLTNLTVLQRLFICWQRTRADEKPGPGQGDSSGNTP